MRTSFISLALCALAFTAQAQPTLRGQITDQETSEPLVGVTVALPAFDTGTATDTDGRYELRVPGPGTIRVVFSYVGYRSETRTVAVGSEPVVLDIRLAPTFVEAPEVTVTAKARESDILSTPQSVAVVGAAGLARASGGSALEALDEVAGVRLLRTGPAIAKPVIRGLTAQRVLVVQDGIRQEGQGWGDEHGPEIGSADVDRIEVVRGPSSLLYGSDALGGVVQTTSDDLFALTDAASGGVNVQGLSGSRLGQVEARLGGRSGATVYETRLGLLRAGDVATPDGLLPNTAHEQRTGTLRLGRELGASTVALDLQHFQSELGLFEPDEFAVGDDTGGRFEIGDPHQTIVHNRVGLRAKVPLGEHRLNLVTGLQQNRRREFSEESGVDPALYLRLTTATTDLRLHHAPLGRVFGTVGVSGLWQRNETLADETLIPGGTTLDGAVYLAEEWVLPTLTLSGGTRLDTRRLDVDAAPGLGVAAQTRSYTALTGALGAAWQPRADLSLGLNLGRAWRAPVLIELFGNGVHEGTARFERGDPDLVPEASLSLDGVVRYLTPHLFAEVSGFVNRIGDYIFPRLTGEVDSASGFLIYDYAQADARLVGAEFRLDVHPHVAHGLGLHLSGDVTAGTNRETGTPLPFVPPARLTTAVEYRTDTFGPASAVELRFGPTFTAAQRRDDVDEIPTDSYTVWDASASATFALGGVTLQPVLAVDNLFDARYVDPLSRFRPFGVPAPGRSVQFRLIATF